MKRLVAVLCLVLCGLCLCACGSGNEDVVRIHIRANSNSEVDQEVKLKVRDSVVDYITPLLATCHSSSEVKVVLLDNLQVIESVADDVLIHNGFLYESKASIRNEYFPTRSYGRQVFSEGYYDALIVELGSGTGDNWWCVAYPPLCFVGDNISSNQVRYKSKLLELINKYFG